MGIGVPLFGGSLKNFPLEFDFCFDFGFASETSARYIIIGDTAVGKSCLLLQFTDPIRALVVFPDRVERSEKNGNL